MKWLNKTLFRKLLISFLTIVLLGYLAIGFIISSTIKDYITEQKKDEMLNQARAVNSVLIEEFGVNDDVNEKLELLSASSDSKIWLFNKEGRIVATSINDEVYTGTPIDQSLVQKTLNGNTSIQVLEIEETQRPMLSVIIPWGDRDQIKGGIILQSPIAGINSTIQNIREIILWSLIVAAVLVGFFVSYLSWSIAKPIQRVERAATEIALGNYRKRVHFNSYDEIGELVKSFNRMANELDEIVKKREAMDQRRNELLANIGHELRTPLTAMNGYLEALQDGLVADPETRQRYYEIMLRETRYLNNLINDLMNLTKLENNEVSLDLYYVNLEEIIRKCMLSMDQEIKKKENKIRLDFPKEVPPLLGDAVRLEQIFMNLISNANKFTEVGSITIEVTSDQHQLVVRISDTGIGIPLHDMDRIWNRFFKVDRGRSKHGRGTGLGLSIVYELVKLHQGKIEVESELGKGSTFTIYFPFLTEADWKKEVH